MIAAVREFTNRFLGRGDATITVPSFDGALLFGAFLVSLSVHERAHALTARRLGDPTGRALDRVSLNPIRHIDPFGTVERPLVPMIQMARSTGVDGIPFGDAKPA